MDDRTYYIALGVLGVAIVAILIDAVIRSYVAPSGLWTVLAAVAGFLGARGALRRNGNGKNGRRR